MVMLILLVLAGFWAGAQNALAGGGSFITLPALILAGLDPRAANITSTAALFPAQISTSLAGRKLVSGTDNLSFRAMLLVSFVGGALGALLLLVTPPRLFAAMVPWLVLFATAVFAWGSFGPKRPESRPRMGAYSAGATQFLIAIYGGYFGGGIGFLMIATLTLAGLAVRNAAATKNALIAVLNASAVFVFAFSPDVHWKEAGMVCLGAIAGGLCGTWMLHRVNEKVLRVLVVVIGILLTIGLFLRGP